MLLLCLGLALFSSFFKSCSFTQLNYLHAVGTCHKQSLCRKHSSKLTCIKMQTAGLKINREVGETLEYAKIAAFT